MYQVLIVDDTDIVRRELKRLKIWGETSGFVISEEACNGQEALNILKRKSFDLIITDIKMPKIDGIELLREVVEDKLCSCVVLLSDYSEFSYARQGIILGAFDYIPKPVNEKEISNLLIRATEYLEDESKEKERIKKLEVLTTENSEDYFKYFDIDMLVKHIASGDFNTLSLVEQMLDRYWDSNQIDFAAIQLTVKNLLKEILEELNGLYPWLEKFIDISQLQTFEVLPKQDYGYMKLLLLDKISELLNLLRVLQSHMIDNSIVGRICSFVLEEVENDISLTTTADSLYMNKTYVSELFKQKTGILFTEYVTAVKMERAKYLILQDKFKSYEIAERLGFRDTEYFSKVFKKSTGLCPTEYRKIMMD